MQPNKSSFKLSLDYRIIIFVLLAVIAGMLSIWKPWNIFGDNGKGERTIRVSGEATVKSEPDEYVFYPNYEFKNTDKAVALKELGSKSEEIVAKLKSLGVEDSKIKTNTNANDYPIYGYPDEIQPENPKRATYSLSLTITVASRELSQKVQDYLVTTAPSGSISPNPTFSESKRKQLDSEARDKATKEARAKADQSAKNLGFKVGAVKSVEDQGGFGEVYPLSKDSVMSSEPSSRLTVQPGENELHYSVTVTYFVR